MCKNYTTNGCIWRGRVSQVEVSKLSISGLAPSIFPTQNLKLLQVDSWNFYRQNPTVLSSRKGTGALLHPCSPSGIHRPSTPVVHHVEPADPVWESVPVNPKAPLSPGTGPGQAHPSAADFRQHPSVLVLCLEETSGSQSESSLLTAPTHGPHFS